MAKICVMALFISFMFCANQSHAKTDNVMSIVKKTEAALNEAQSGTKQISVTVKDAERVTAQLIVRAAHKQLEDGTRTLFVILEPETLRGTGFTYWKPKGESIQEWAYYPSTRRVRKLTNLTFYESILGTDFTHADLVFQDPGGKHKLLGKEKFKGTDSYKIETTPRANWYYSRIISWIAADTFLPIKREYYDAGGNLWKIKLFENIIVLNNVPIPLRIRMLYILNHRSTKCTLSDLCGDAVYLTKETFDPEKLPGAIFSPFCTIKLLKDK